MKKNKSIIEIISGAFVLIISFFLIAYTYKKSYWQVQKTYLLKADFDSVDGLREGSPVKISGVIVGTVTSISINQETYSAVVTFYINDSVKLPKDTTAAITSESLLGSKNLSLTPGGEKEFLLSNDTIFNTQAATNLESLLQKYIFNSEPKDAKENGTSSDENNTEKDTKDSPPKLEKKLDGNEVSLNKNNLFV